MNGYRKMWTEERVERELLECIKTLQIDRMPTADELKSLGRNDLHIKISRTRKYSGWAEYLGLSRKESCTLNGQNMEETMAEKLRQFGHEVERMTTKHPYDLLVNGTVKIDVKTGCAYDLRGSRVHTFGINKKSPTCDIYICTALNESGTEIERTFVIPSHHLKVVSLSIGKDSVYNRFIDKWEYIDHYSKFFSQVI
jgi:hypothetical protein